MIRHLRAASLLAVAVLASVAACSEPAENPSQQSPTPSSSATVVEPVEVTGEVTPPESDAGPTPEGGTPASSTTVRKASTREDTERDGEGDVEARSPETVEGVEAPPSGSRSGSEESGSQEKLPAASPEEKPDTETNAPEPGMAAPAPVNNILLSGPYRPDIDVRFDGGEIRAMVTGTVGLQRRQVYAMEAAAGQRFAATLDARPGVWLDVRLGHDVILSEAEQRQRVEAILPSGGAWRVSVVASDEDFSDYGLTILVVSPEPVPEPESEPAKPPPVAVPAGAGIGPEDVVHLTFDDGPHPSNTPQVLDILARYGARATFFVLGSLVERHPDLFGRIVSEGHTVANHTWGHENLAKLSREEFDRTISRTQEILGEHATPCLRPPYAATGKHTREWAAEHGLEVYLWSVSANDWLGLNAAEIADRIVSQVTDGSIVLMHDGGGNRAQTVRGLEMVLERLSDRGVRYEPLCR